MLIALIQHKIQNAVVTSSKKSEDKPSVVVDTSKLFSEDSWGMDRVNAEVA